MFDSREGKRQEPLLSRLSFWICLANKSVLSNETPPFGSVAKCLLQSNQMFAYKTNHFILLQAVSRAALGFIFVCLVLFFGRPPSN